MTPRRQTFHWYIFLLTIGAASTAVEITGLRFLAPLFGSSLPVWGAAIATVLAGLAGGYGYGGRRAEQLVPARLVFQSAAGGAAVFLWAPAAFQLATHLRNLYLKSNSPLTLAMTLVVSFLILLVPSIIFGMVSPLAVQVEAARRGQRAGQVAGRTSALTTIGSLLGILLPSFITIPLLGTRATVWLFALPALLLALLPLWRQHRGPSLLVLATCGVLTLLIPPATSPNVIYATETKHQYVSVKESKGNRFLTFDASLGIQSVATSATYINGYWDYAAALPALLPEKPAVSVLVLGAAASTTERQMQRLWAGKKKFTFTSVELDAALFDIASTYFDPPPRETVAADARAHVSADPKTYDLIILDVYTRELTVPFHLATAEFFQQVRPRLRPSGIFALNVNALSPQTLWVRSLARTLQRVFPEVRLTHVPDSCNYILLAADNPWPTPAATQPAAIQPLMPTLVAASPPGRNGIILTDDRSPTDLLGLLAFVPASNPSSAPPCS